jgi:hypothetical protein
MEPVEPTGANPPVDRALGQPHPKELRARYDPVLPLRQPSHGLVQRSRLHLASICDVGCSLGRHATTLTVPGARVARWV